jgi:hypothetical protein
MIFDGYLLNTHWVSYEKNKITMQGILKNEMFVLANISFFEMPYEFFCIWIYYNIYRKILSMLVRY